MSPDDLAAVAGSWAELESRRDEVVAHLAAGFAALDPAPLAAARACWLVEAVADLVGLLPTPSTLEEQARLLAQRWPVSGSSPSFAVEGRAFLCTARLVCATWSPPTEQAWRNAWLLLSDVLAEQTLSPFSI